MFCSVRSIRVMTVASLFVIGSLILVGCARAGGMDTAAQRTPLVVPTSARSSAPPTQPAVPKTAVPRTQAPTATPTVTTPTDLVQHTAAGKGIPLNGWIVGDVVLGFSGVGVGSAELVPQVEVVRAGSPFRGVPTASGPPVVMKASRGDATITLKDLAPGEYRWQARFEDAETKRAGQWSAYAEGNGGFGVVGEVPRIQNLKLNGAGRTVDGIGVVGANDRAFLNWSVTISQPLALDHVAYLADHEQTAPSDPPAPSIVLDASSRSLPLDSLADGVWYVHFWAVDKAGQVSPPATVPVTLMKTPPKFENVIFRTWVTNPLYQTETIRFSITHAADVDVSILAAASVTPVRTFNLGRQAATKSIEVVWDGKDGQGHVVAPGSYRFLVDATDDAGNRAQALYTGLAITNKVIKISLGKQELIAYDGDKPFLSTLVTSGGQDIPTPTGIFEILEKAAPFVFHSPFPRGSQYWYPDTKANYAMLFDQRDADFVHDAPWRSKFGPGTNGPGVPGQPYTGSHGCVETPANVMPRLYPWTPLGTPVVIAQ